MEPSAARPAAKYDADLRLHRLTKELDDAIQDKRLLFQLQLQLLELCQRPTSEWSHPRARGQCWDTYAHVCALRDEFAEAATAVERSVQLLTTEGCVEPLRVFICVLRTETLLHRGYSAGNVEIGREYVKISQLHFHSGNLLQSHTFARLALEALDGFVTANDPDLAESRRLLQFTDSRPTVG